ncbi:MAG TPA: PaaI family thioesterase [Actinomycetota bacterium]
MSENRTPPGFTREQALATAGEIGRGTFLERIELEWLEVGLDRLVARIPVAGNTQPYGILHGGATAALCETVGSFGTSIHVGLDRRPVGVQLSVNHLRAVREGHVTATGVPLHVGRTIALWEIRVEDDGGRLVAVGTLTLVIRDAVPG